MDSGENLEFNLLDNALDFISSASEHVSDGSSGAWKYAILHLVAGIELLIKSRLQQEHWSLLFAQTDKASKTSLTTGDFVSVDFETAIKRLQNIANVRLDNAVIDHFNVLRKLRNRIQHFDVKLNVEQTKAQVAKGSLFALEFCEDELESTLDANHQVTLQSIHSNLADLDEYVQEKMN